MAQRAKQVWHEQGSHAARPNRIGDTIGNYVILRALGEGNMGQVVLANHKQMKRKVALKFISPELLSSSSARTRFQREIEATAKLQHPNLVIAHDAGIRRATVQIVVDEVVDNAAKILLQIQGVERNVHLGGDAPSIGRVRGGTAALFVAGALSDREGEAASSV